MRIKYGYYIFLYVSSHVYVYICLFIYIIIIFTYPDGEYRSATMLLVFCLKYSYYY
jgi:hypothetical protein